MNHKANELVQRYQREGRNRVVLAQPEQALSEHTPLPWSVSTAFQDANSELPCWLKDANGKVILSHKEREVLRQIAVSVNNHASLVAALEEVRTWLISPATDKDTIQEMREIVSDALSRVRE